MESLNTSLSISSHKLCPGQINITTVESIVLVHLHQSPKRSQRDASMKAVNTIVPVRCLLPVFLLYLLCSVSLSTGESTQSLSSPLRLLSSTIDVASQIHSNHSLNNNDREREYEKLIYSCLAKINTQMERCVHKFNKSLEQHTKWTRTSGTEQSAEKARRYCCLQNEFKDCWTWSIQAGCSELESRLSKWLPFQVLTDLRTDDRCRTYVLYPHKCRDNSFSLWQILAFLLLVPFVAFFLILFAIVMGKRNFKYRSLKRSQFDLM